jgi:SOS-response transcriptional repressor LexA
MDWVRIIDKIETMLANVGGNKENLAKMLGFRPQYISDIKSGKSKNPGADFTLALINRLNLNPEWLETGKGDMLRPKLGMKEAGLLAKYGGIISEIEHLMDIGRAHNQGIEKRLSALEQGRDTDDALYAHEPEPEYGALYVEGIACGPPIEQAADGEDYVQVPARFFKGGDPRDFYVGRAIGQSMTMAGIPDGARVLIRRGEEPRDGEIQVVACRGTATLKRVRRDGDAWRLCYEDGTDRYIQIAAGEEYTVQGDFVAVLPESKQGKSGA